MIKSCYLAGPFTNPDWRDKIISEVPNMEYYDPRTDTVQGSIAEFVLGDLRGVQSCDCCFVYSPTGRGEIGASIEAAWAAAHGKLVILCAEASFVHPMLIGISSRVFYGLENGIRYLNNLITCETEFEAAYKMWEI